MFVIRSNSKLRILNKMDEEVIVSSKHHQRQHQTPKICNENDDEESSITTLDSSTISNQLSASNCQSSTPRPSKVKFDKVTIREYGITAGDNPSCSYGAPISLSWEYDDSSHEAISVDEFEAYRVNERYGRPMRLNVHTRHNMLTNWDVPKEEIIEAAKNCKIARFQRKETLQTLSHRPKFKNRILKVITSMLYT